MLEESAWHILGAGPSSAPAGPSKAWGMDTERLFDILESDELSEQA